MFPERTAKQPAEQPAAGVAKEDDACQGPIGQESVSSGSIKCRERLLLGKREKDRADTAGALANLNEHNSICNPHEANSNISAIRAKPVPMRDRMQSTDAHLGPREPSQRRSVLPESTPLRPQQHHAPETF